MKVIVSIILVAAALAPARAADEATGEVISPEEDGVARVTGDVRAGFLHFARGPADLDESFWGYRFDVILEIPTKKWGFQTAARVLRFPGENSSTATDWDVIFKRFLVKTPFEAYVGPSFGIGYGVAARDPADGAGDKFTQSLVRAGLAAGARVPLGEPYFAVRFSITSQITFDECEDEWVDQSKQLNGFNVFPEVALEGEFGYQVHERIAVNGKFGFIAGQFLLNTRPFERNELVPYVQFGPSFYF
jgi:hypothetical protein